MATCLIIEESETMRVLTSRIIDDLGLSTVTTGDVQDAIKLIENNAPDVVVLDWDLPSFGALDFLKAFAELQPEQKVPVILCATENDPQQFALARAAGAEHHILKPFEAYQLAQIFSELGFADAHADLKPKDTAAVGGA